MVKHIAINHKLLCLNPTITPFSPLFCYYLPSSKWVYIPYWTDVSNGPAQHGKPFLSHGPTAGHVGRHDRLHISCSADPKLIGSCFFVLEPSRVVSDGSFGQHYRYQSRFIESAHRFFFFFFFPTHTPGTSSSSSSPALPPCRASARDSDAWPAATCSSVPPPPRRPHMSPPLTSLTRAFFHGRARWRHATLLYGPHFCHVSHASEGERR